MKKPAILAVDDTRGNLVALEAVPENDFDVVTAGSGTRAIELLAAHQEDPNVSRHPDRVHHGRLSRRPIREAGVRGRRCRPSHQAIRSRAASLEGWHLQRVPTEGGGAARREQHLLDTEELITAGRKLSAVLESLPVGILLADIDGRIGQANEVLVIKDTSETKQIELELENRVTRLVLLGVELEQSLDT
jgi:PAS domain-containing protein